MRFKGGDLRLERCGWNPDADLPAFEGEEHREKLAEYWVEGIPKGGLSTRLWALCESCSKHRRWEKMKKTRITYRVLIAPPVLGDGQHHTIVNPKDVPELLAGLVHEGEERERVTFEIRTMTAAEIEGLSSYV